VNPNGINLQVPSPDFGYGAFRHIQIGAESAISPSNPGYAGHNKFLSFHQDTPQDGVSQSEIQDVQSELPSQRKFNQDTESLDHQIQRENGAIQGYSLIRLQRKESKTKPFDDQTCKTQINIYFKKLQLGYNFKINFTSI